MRRMIEWSYDDDKFICVGHTAFGAQLQVCEELYGPKQICPKAYLATAPSELL